MLNVSDTVLLLSFPVYILGGLVVSICYSTTAKGIRRPDACRDLSYRDRRIKLWHPPCDLLIWGFILSQWISTAIAAANGAMGIGLSCFVLLLFGIPYGLTRIFMLWASVSVCREILTQAAMDRKIPVRTANLHIFLHFLPIADIISACWVYHALSRIAYDEHKAEAFFKT